jgi:hypothetical protein
MLVVLSICTAIMIAPVEASDLELPDERSPFCRLDGSWIGNSPDWGNSWLVEYQSIHPWRGSFTLRFIGGDPTMGGAFPVDSHSIAVGSWVRTGWTSFEYTMVYYGLAAGGQEPLVLIKLTGEVVTAADCQTLDVYNEWIAVYDPAQDPFGTDDPAYGCTPDGSVSPTRRVPVQDACVSDIP